MAERHPYFEERPRSVVMPKLRCLLEAFRTAGGEVIYTVMENPTADCRDRSLDCKLSKFFIAKGS